MNALKSLNPYFWKHRKMYGIGLIFIFLSNFFSIYWVQYLGETVDLIQKVLSEQQVDKNTLLKTLAINGGLIVGASITAGVFRFFMRQTVIVASREIEYELKTRFINTTKRCL